MAENNGIPEGADKILFAEDVVNYMMLLLEDIKYPYPSMEPFRNLVHNGFNNTCQCAIYFLKKKMESYNEKTFCHMRNNNSVNATAYVKVANSFRKKYLSEGFEARSFLHYCVYLATLATNFYMDGVQEAPSIAVSYIVRGFRGFDMTAGGWDTLNLIAEQCKSMRQDSWNQLSPFTSDDDDDMDRIIYEFSDVNYSDETDDDEDINSKVEQNPAVNETKKLQQHKECYVSERDSPSSSEKSSEEPVGKKCKCKSSSDGLKEIYSALPPIHVKDKILNDNSCTSEQFGPGPSNVDKLNLCSHCGKSTVIKVKSPIDKNNLNNESVSDLKSGKQSDTKTELPKFEKFSPSSSDG